MDHSEFVTLADDCLNKVADWLEDFDADEVDFETTDGVVTIEFPDRTKYILNRQAAASQMWFAAGARAWHYNWDGSQWCDDRDGHPLMGRIREALSEKLKREL
ncbi:MAG: iron donor protein CyaY [Planctomycetota bacterium]|jgi:CyaY protein|nr:iron donor protein CyaY [Planctomycetota bacterium]